MILLIGFGMFVLDDNKFDNKFDNKYINRYDNVFLLLNKKY